LKKYFAFALLILISLVFFAGCVNELVVPENGSNSPESEDSLVYENPSGSSSTGKGTLKLYLTDAPGEFLQLNIVISRIDGHISVDGEGEEGYWKELVSWPGGLPVDLLILQGVSLLLGSSELDVNHYTQLRVFLKEEAELVVEEEGGSVPYTLTIPSSANTGIKLNRPFDIVEGEITKLTLDFDAHKSIIKTGNDKYKMKPVITVLSENYSSEELPELFGSVSGNVFYYDNTALDWIGISGANIEFSGITYFITKTTTSLAESLPEVSEGDFELLDVPAGIYTLNVVADAYYNYSEFDVEVVDGVNPLIFIELLPLGISGTVVDSVYGFPVEGAEVSVVLGGGIPISTLTDAEGNFSIEQLSLGTYDLTISLTGYESYSDVTPGSGIPVTAEGERDIGTIGLIPITP